MEQMKEDTSGKETLQGQSLLKKKDEVGPRDEKDPPREERTREFRKSREKGVHENRIARQGIILQQWGGTDGPRKNGPARRYACQKKREKRMGPSAG